MVDMWHTTHLDDCVAEKGSSRYLSFKPIQVGTDLKIFVEVGSFIYVSTALSEIPLVSKNDTSEREFRLLPGMFTKSELLSSNDNLLNVWERKGGDESDVVADVSRVKFQPHPALSETDTISRWTFLHFLDSPWLLTLRDHVFLQLGYESKPYVIPLTRTRKEGLYHIYEATCSSIRTILSPSDILEHIFGIKWIVIMITEYVTQGEWLNQIPASICDNVPTKNRADSTYLPISSLRYSIVGDNQKKENLREKNCT